MAGLGRQGWVAAAALALLVSLGSCGPFQVGVEQSPASPEIAATAPAGLSPATPANPEPEGTMATVSALQTANARLAAEVARLTAERTQFVATVQAAPAATPLPTTAPLPPTVPPPLTPTPMPAATVGPLIPTRITFPAGSASATVSPDLTASGPRAYVLKVLAGQHLILSADQDLDVQVSGPDGRLLAPFAIRPQQWEYVVGQTGDQTITLNGEGRPTVTIYVPPR